MSPSLLKLYAGWLATVHPAIVKEFAEMKRPKREGLTPNVVPLFKYLGWPEIVRQLGQEGLIDREGLKAIIDQVGVKGFVAQLDTEQRRELLRLLQTSPPPTKRGRKPE